MTRSLALLACLALAGCGAPVIPVPVQDKKPCQCDCSIDEITLKLPIPSHVWQEMLEEWEQERRREPGEWPAVDK